MVESSCIQFNIMSRPEVPITYKQGVDLAEDQPSTSRKGNATLPNLPRYSAFPAWSRSQGGSQTDNNRQSSGPALIKEPEEWIKVCCCSDSRISHRYSTLVSSSAGGAPLQAGLVRDGHIPDKPGRTPHIRIVALVPIDKALPQRDARNGCPTAAQAHVVLAVEEVCRIPWVQVHGLETLVRRQRSARPFPQPAEVGLAA